MTQEQESSVQSKTDQTQAGILHWYSPANIIPNIIRVLGFLVTSGLIVWALGQWSDYQKSINSTEEEFRKLSIEISARKLALRPHLNNLMLKRERADYWNLYETIEDTKYEIFPEYEKYKMISLVSNAYSLLPRLPEKIIQTVDQDIIRNYITSAAHLRNYLRDCFYNRVDDQRENLCEWGYTEAMNLQGLIGSPSFFPLPL